MGQRLGQQTPYLLPFLSWPHHTGLPSVPGFAGESVNGTIGGMVNTID